MATLVQVWRWSQQYQAQLTGEALPEMIQLIDWLKNHIPPDDSDPNCVRISHGDYRCNALALLASEPCSKVCLHLQIGTAVAASANDASKHRRELCCNVHMTTDAAFAYLASSHTENILCDGVHLSWALACSPV